MLLKKENIACDKIEQMEETAKKLYDSLKNYRSVKALIDEAETEGLFLECKSPSQPRVTRSFRKYLAKALSGFSNTRGGVFVVGVEAKEREGEEVDQLINIPEIANCSYFRRTIVNKIPTLTVPSVLGCEAKVIKRRPSNTSGLVVIYIPRTIGDPVRSNEDQKFYCRMGEAFMDAPYELIKSLFTANKSPDVCVVMKKECIKIADDGSFEISLYLANKSNAIGEYIVADVEVLNKENCQEIGTANFRDLSGLNPGKTIYKAELHGVLHKGINMRLGMIRVDLKGRKKKLQLLVTIFAKDMVAREQNIDLILNRNNPLIKLSKERMLY